MEREKKSHDRIVCKRVIFTSFWKCMWIFFFGNFIYSPYDFLVTSLQSTNIPCNHHFTQSHTNQLSSLSAWQHLSLSSVMKNPLHQEVCNSVVQVCWFGIPKTFHCFLNRIPEFLKYSQFSAHLKMGLDPQEPS